MRFAGCAPERDGRSRAPLFRPWNARRPRTYRGRHAKPLPPWPEWYPAIRNRPPSTRQYLPARPSASARRFDRKSNPEAEPAVLCQILGKNRQFPQTFTRDGKNRVGNGRHNRRRAGFTYSAGRRLAGHDIHFHHRHFVDTKYVVMVEIALLHAAVVESNGAFQRSAQAINDAALDLGNHTRRIHHVAAIHRAHHAMNFQLALLHRYLSHLRIVAADIIDNSDTPAMAGRKRLAPPRF